MLYQTRRVAFAARRSAHSGAHLASTAARRTKCQDDQLAGRGELPDAEITGELLKVSPLKKSVPEEAERLEDEAFAIVPHLKITELLLEVDQWTEFTRHFTHLRSGDSVRDRSMLLTVILADAINLGLAKMAEASAGTTFLCPMFRCVPGGDV